MSRSTVFFTDLTVCHDIPINALHWSIPSSQASFYQFVTECRGFPLPRAEYPISYLLYTVRCGNSGSGGLTLPQPQRLLTKIDSSQFTYPTEQWFGHVSVLSCVTVDTITR